MGANDKPLLIDPSRSSNALLQHPPYLVIGASVDAEDMFDVKEIPDMAYIADIDDIVEIVDSAVLCLEIGAIEDALVLDRLTQPVCRADVGSAIRELRLSELDQVPVELIDAVVSRRGDLGASSCGNILGDGSRGLVEGTISFCDEVGLCSLLSFRRKTLETPNVFDFLSFGREFGGVGGGVCSGLGTPTG